jgi:hypothetical protein
MAEKREIVALLDQVVAPPVRECGRTDSDDLGSRNLLGWLVPLSSAAQPISVNQIGLERGTHAVGWAALAAHAVVVGVGPPGLQVLETPDPGLALPVGDGRADLRPAVGVGGVEPVEMLASRDVGGEVVDGMDIAPRSVEMVRPVAPVRERQVVVDPDHVDGGVGPERVEMEDLVLRAGVAGGRGIRSSRRRR